MPDKYTIEAVSGGKLYHVTRFEGNVIELSVDAKRTFKFDPVTAWRLHRILENSLFVTNVTARAVSDHTARLVDGKKFIKQSGRVAKKRKDYAAALTNLFDAQQAALVVNNRPLYDALRQKESAVYVALHKQVEL